MFNEISKNIFMLSNKPFINLQYNLNFFSYALCLTANKKDNKNNRRYQIFSFKSCTLCNIFMYRFLNYIQMYNIYLNRYKKCFIINRLIKIHIFLQIFYEKN